MKKSNIVSRFYNVTCNRLSRIIPKKTRKEKINQMLEFGGIEEDYDLWIGKRMFLSLIIGIIGLLIPWNLGKIIGINFETLITFQLLELSLPFYPLIISIGLGIGIMIATGIMFYLHLFYLIEGRASMVESFLPDFLQLVSSNINAGMTSFTAFRSSARKEFGPLSEEIKKASSKSMGSQSFTEGLKALTKRINSKTLKETVSFFSQALKSGGHLSKLLEVSANDLRQSQEMKKELLSSTRMYVIFVMFAVVIATPLMLSISIQFLTMVENIQSENPVVSSDEVSSLGFLSGELAITSEFMQSMAMLLLLGNALMASLFVGVLSNGKAKLGLKYFPIILIISFIVFFASRTLLGQFLGI